MDTLKVLTLERLIGAVAGTYSESPKSKGTLKSVDLVLKAVQNGATLPTEAQWHTQFGTITVKQGQRVLFSGTARDAARTGRYVAPTLRTSYLMDATGADNFIGFMKVHIPFGPVERDGSVLDGYGVNLDKDPVLIEVVFPADGGALDGRELSVLYTISDVKSTLMLTRNCLTITPSGADTTLYYDLENGQNKYLYDIYAYQATVCSDGTGDVATLEYIGFESNTMDYALDLIPAYYMNFYDDYAASEGHFYHRFGLDDPKSLPKLIDACRFKYLCGDTTAFVLGAGIIVPA